MFYIFWNLRELIIISIIYLLVWSQGVEGEKAGLAMAKIK